MKLEIEFERAENVELFDHLVATPLSDKGAFPIDIADVEYISIPRQVSNTGDIMRCLADIVLAD